MDIMDFMWSFKGNRLMQSGIEGVHWNLVNGKPQLTQEAIDMYINKGPDWEKTGIQCDGNFFGLSPFTRDPDDGGYMDLYQDSPVYSRILTPLDKDFCNHYGVSFPGEIFQQKIDAGLNTTLDTPVFTRMLEGSLMPDISDDQKIKEAKCIDIMVKATAKCILSKSDAEFEQNRANTIKELEAAGTNEIYKWYADEYEKAGIKSQEVMGQLLDLLK